MRVVSFNIWLGGGDRWKGILEVIEGLAPDVLVLQECTGWESDPTRFDEVRSMLGVAPKNAMLGRSGREHNGRRFNVAVFSRLDVRAFHVHNDPRFIERAVVECRLESVTVLGSHFTASDEPARFVEMHWLTRAAAADAIERPTLLTGDLNSLSRRDPYGDLGDALVRAKVDKYGHPPRFDVTDALEQQGWVDTLYAHGAPASWISAPREDDGIRYDTRLDYAFASPSLAPRVAAVELHVLQHGESDHYPLVTTIDAAGVRGA